MKKALQIKVLEEEIRWLNSRLRQLEAERARLLRNRELSQPPSVDNA
jgi:hypothetical protein